MTVVPFPAQDEETITGLARCLACRHEWQAVAPAGTSDMECPECHCLRGTWKHPIGADVGEAEFICTNCRSTAYVFIRHEGQTKPTCLGCGITADIDELFPEGAR